MIRLTLTVPGVLLGQEDAEIEPVEIDAATLPVAEFLQAVRQEFGLPPGNYQLRNLETGEKLRTNTTISRDADGGKFAVALLPGRLRGILRAENGQTFPIEQPILVMGRPSAGKRVDVDLTSLDPGRTTSRPHAQILQQEDGHYLQALNSSNGTFVNEQQLEPHTKHPLQDHDRIQMGDVVLDFHLQQKR